MIHGGRWLTILNIFGALYDLRFVSTPLVRPRNKLRVSRVVFFFLLDELMMVAWQAIMSDL